ncbi:MAG: hypothetical protein M0014_10760, partial [Actinomycetota bacterium]|nr:hypothetical protein [Actinomycetota bacterium]
MQRWAFDRYDEELAPALVEHLKGRGVGTTARPAGDQDMALSSAWLLIDRPLACGDTPARRYAALSELPARERWLAGRIAGSRLGVHRVIDAEPGAWIELEDVLSGTRARVDSPNVSEVAVRWHVLICRVERGGPVPALWGGAAFYEPNEEAEILAELQRIAKAHGLGTDASGLAAALDAGAREMACFVAPSRLAKRTLHTLEGDPVALGEATWRLRDRAAALRALCGTSELTLRRADDDTLRRADDDTLRRADDDTLRRADDDTLRRADDDTLRRADDDSSGSAFDWLARRRDLVARRPLLPPGALVIEGGPLTLDERGELEDSDATSLGTFTVRAEVLEFSCLSAQRLDGAVALVER